MKKYAHIYNAPKASGFKYKLIFTSTANLYDAVGEPEYSNSKKELKDKAKAAGAQAWNY